MWSANGHMPVIQNPFYYIDKNNITTERPEAIKRLSYLAKVRGKGYRKPQAKDYVASRLKNTIKPFIKHSDLELKL